MIIKTTGIVLRLDPYSKTSQVITWLTPDHGRTVTLAKGAKRIKSNLVGQYDCFYTCELLFYQSRHSSLHILKECSPLATRQSFRTDWRAAFTASYLCDLLSRLTPPGAACPTLFDWAEQTLDFLATQGTSETVLNWSELKLLKHLGVAPQLSKCLNCGTQSFPLDRPVTFSISRGGLLCNDCLKGYDDSITLPLTHDVLGMLRGWESTDTPAMAKRTLSTPRQSESANRLLDSFIHCHLQSIFSRDIISSLI
ncbi:MAG: DNA repair protein RecO [bacterium]|jgi:DNA repair protein RecO (recombination protein O)